MQQNNNGANAEKPQADLWNPYWNQFAPRVGFAWDVQGNGRTSVRASYGLNYDDYPSDLPVSARRASSHPGVRRHACLLQQAGLDDPWRGIPGGNPFPLQLTKNMPFVPGGDYLPSNPDLTPTYTQTWNLSLQREVVPGTLVSAELSGNPDHAPSGGDTTQSGHLRSWRRQRQRQLLPQWPGHTISRSRQAAPAPPLPIRRIAVR